MTSSTLTMLPLFVMMGNLAAHRGLSTWLYKSMSTLIGHHQGGLYRGVFTANETAVIGPAIVLI